VQRYTFQRILARLTEFWAKQGCTIYLPFDSEMGAATFHPATVKTVLDQKESRVAFMQPCRRPQDARGGQNPNRLYRHHQFQVIIMPPPKNIQTLVIHSLYECGVQPDIHNIEFVENNWKSPSLGANGKGYEIQVNGTEVLQFTYFQQLGGASLGVIPIELAYGLERLALVVQDVDHMYDIIWDDSGVTYGHVNHFFEAAHEVVQYNPSELTALLNNYETIYQSIIKEGSRLPPYEMFLKMSHCFNLIEATGELGFNDRVVLLSKVRQCANRCLQGGSI